MQTVRKRGSAMLLWIALSIMLQGCVASFFDGELNNRGGYIDAKLDDHWMIADTKPMRVLRAYVLIGSVARLAQTKYDSEREAIVKQVNIAVKVAADAYYCAYTQPGRCVYFDERMVEAEIAVLRLLVAVLSKKEDEDLFEALGKQLSETFPLLKSVESLTKLLDSLLATGEAAVTTGKLITSILKAGKVIYFQGRRLGALYRDSVELQMVTVLSSLDAVCAIKREQFVGFSTSRLEYGKQDWLSKKPPPGEQPEYKYIYNAYRNFYGDPSELPDTCAAFAEGHKIWLRGAGHLGLWVEFLHGTAEQYRSFVIPNENAFIQASDLIWRSCEHLTSNPEERSDCIGRRPAAERGEAANECAVDFDRPKPDTKRVLKSAKTAKDLEDKYAHRAIECRLILYAKVVAQRGESRLQSGANTRIYWLSIATASPSHPLRYHPGQ